MMTQFVLLALLAGGVVLLARRRRRDDDAAHTARTLRRTAFGAMALYTLLVGAFIAAEAFGDPGGWAGIGLVGLWAVPLAVVGVLAWRRPDLGVRVLGAGVGLMAVVSVWFAAQPDAWRRFEDARGPVRVVAIFVLAAALGVLGLRRPAAAGLELVLLALVPPLVAALGSRAGSSSLVAVVSLPLVAGVLYLVSVTLQHHGGRPAH